MDACGLIQQLNCCASVNNVIIISIFDRPTIVSGRKSAMDKLVDDGYTMNANSAGGAPALVYLRHVVLRHDS